MFGCTTPNWSIRARSTVNTLLTAASTSLRITSLMASKQVGIESIVQKEELDENCVPIILITDPFKESDHSELHKELLTIESVKNIRSIRIESN